MNCTTGIDESDLVESPQVPAGRRPRLFRALGDADPPAEIEVAGQLLSRVENLKHDSWAASALYRNSDLQVVCKFNRIQPILFLPCRWLGRLLAQREKRTYALLEQVGNVPSSVGPVRSQGRVAEHAVAHEYVAGHPLRWHDRVDDEFFPKLYRILEQIHARGIAYVDMNKCENIIVGQDGQPYLIDFQISVRLPRIWPFRVLLRMLQQSDNYHLQKHLLRFRPDMEGRSALVAFDRSRPWWITWHRRIAGPFRNLRRRALVLLGVRRGEGKAWSEGFVEEALRVEGCEQSPMLQLQATLMSDEYYHSKGGTDRDYVLGMFEDLVGRAPADLEDRHLLQPLLNGSRSRLESTAIVLRSPQVYEQSDKLSDAWLRVAARRLRCVARVA